MAPTWAHEYELAPGHPTSRHPATSNARRDRRSGNISPNIPPNDLIVPRYPGTGAVPWYDYAGHGRHESSEKQAGCLWFRRMLRIGHMEYVAGRKIDHMRSGAV